MARPTRQFDEAQILELAKIHCTHEEIAAVLGCSAKTIQRRFVHLIEKGRQHGKMSLRRSMFKNAIDGSATMQIWLSKQHLGMSDKIEQKSESSPIALRIVMPDDGDD